MRTRLQRKLVVGLWFALSWCAGALAQSWERLGPEGGLVVSLGTDARGGVYLGTADGHVFFSGDGARSWELRGRVGSRLDAVVTRLMPDPRAANVIFASVWYRAAGAGGGVFRSEDGGRSWTLLGLPEEAVRALEMAPSRPDTLIAGTLTGIFRSRDAGKNWERISPVGDEELRNVDSVAIDPRDPELVYVGTYHLPWKTADGGKSWTPVTAGIIDDSDVMSLRIDASNPLRLFMSACSGIYRSENQGAQWIKLQGIPYSARRTQAIVQDPGDAKTLYAGTTEGLWVTRDGGESWTRTTVRDWVVNSVVVISGESGGERLVLGTESRGVQVSDDAGVHFAEANHGFTHEIVDQLVSDPNQDGHFLAVVERAEEKIVESRDSGKTWASISMVVSAGGGKAERLSQEQVRQVYASPWGWLARTADGRFWLREEEKGWWKEWKPRLAVASARGKKTQASKAAGVRELSVTVAGALIVFAHDAAIVSTSLGLVRCGLSGTCNALKAYGRGGAIRAVWVSADDANFAVVRDGKLGISANGGGSAVWRDVPVTNEQVLWVDGSQSEAGNTLFLGTSSGLYLSRDGANSWTHVRGGLPEAPVVHWLHDAKFWVVTQRDGAMYVSGDEGGNWQRIDGDAERGEFTGLAWAGEGSVLAGSQSEGLLKVTLP